MIFPIKEDVTLLKGIRYLLIFAFLIWTSLLQAESDFSYRTLGPLTLKLKINFQSGKMIAKIHNLRTKDSELNQIVQYHKGWLYHSEKESLYGEGYSRKEFEREVRNANHPQSNYAFLLMNFAHANESECLDQNEFQGISNLNKSVKFGEMGKMISGCNFSISGIIQKQIESTYEFTHDVVTGKIWTQISQAIETLKETFPQIYDKLIIPIQSLLSSAPSLAKGMVCNFLSNKIGHIALVALTGGAGLSTTLARLSEDVAEVVTKVDLFTKNPKLLRSLTDLEKNGHMDSKTIEQMLKLKNDVPTALKNANVKFRTPENLQKHFEKHGTEIGAKNIEDYQSAAQKFLKSEGGADTVSIELPGGDFGKWNTSTGEYIATNKYGNILTYFKLSCKKEYERLLYLTNPKEAGHQGICKER